MTWLYRLQTRAGLTGPEGTAAVVLVVALTLGFIAREVQSNAAPIAPDFYAAADAAFSRAPLDSTSAPAPTTSVLTLASAQAPIEATDPSVEWADTLSTSEETHEAPPAAIASAAVSAGSSSRRSGKPPPHRMNINTASVDELQALPRVGPALAARIVEYRRVNGRFRTAEQITEVRGIGDRTLEKIAPWIYV